MTPELNGVEAAAEEPVWLEVRVWEREEAYTVTRRGREQKRRLERYATVSKRHVHLGDEHRGPRGGSCSWDNVTYTFAEWDAIVAAVAEARKAGAR